jgi:hypothetical protein
MSALPRVHMGCALSTGTMETGRVAAVRPVGVVLLAAARAGCTGVAAPAGAVDEVGGALLATAYVGGIGAAALVVAGEGLDVPGPGEWPGIPGLVLIHVEGGKGACTVSSAPRGAGVASLPTRTNGAPGTRAVRSCSSSRKSKAEDAMGVVDILVKGKKDSSKTTCREIRMRFD